MAPTISQRSVSPHICHDSSLPEPLRVHSRSPSPCLSGRVQASQGLGIHGLSYRMESSIHLEAATMSRRPINNMGRKGYNSIHSTPPREPSPIRPWSNRSSPRPSTPESRPSSPSSLLSVPMYSPPSSCGSRSPPSGLGSGRKGYNRAPEQPQQPGQDNPGGRKGYNSRPRSLNPSLM